MIPQHVLDDLGPDQRVAILIRNGELRFLVHEPQADPARVLADARQNGCEVIATHLADKDAILALVAGRERDIGGEG